MSSAEIVRRYNSVVADLDEIEVGAVWAAVLFGRTPSSERMRSATALLNALRDDVGRARLHTNQEQKD